MDLCEFPVIFVHQLIHLLLLRKQLLLGRLRSISSAGSVHVFTLRAVLI